MSFQQGLSGLNATSKNLQVIGNNIANANTFGAKVARAEFADMYASAVSGAGSHSADPSHRTDIAGYVVRNSDAAGHIRRAAVGDA